MSSFLPRAVQSKMQQSVSMQIFFVPSASATCTVLNLNNTVSYIITLFFGKQIKSLKLISKTFSF
jgi:hypothetical protein